MSDEIDELRKAQVVAVMPLIGILLDSWDGLPNDLKSDPGMEDFPKIMTRINGAMEGESFMSGVDAEARPATKTPRRAENLAYYLRIYIHAHQADNVVPPNLEAEAIRAVQGLAEPRGGTAGGGG